MPHERIIFNNIYVLDNRKRKIFNNPDGLEYVTENLRFTN